jgi:DNA-directed RNA polymerase specialized sigma24 family protein
MTTDLPAGNPAHLSELLERCRPLLLQRIVRRVGARLALRVDPEDVVQDSLAVAARVLSTVPACSAEDVVRFAEAVARRRLYHEARQQRVRAALSLEGETESEPHRPSSPLGPRRALLQELAWRSAHLQPEHQWVLLLRTWMCAPWDSVSLVLGRATRDGSERLYERARGRLKQV